jgi:hypothetical protein
MWQYGGFLIGLRRMDRKIIDERSSYEDESMRCLAVSAIVVLFPIFASAQDQPATTTPPSASPAKSIGMFAYPKNKQSPEQQLTDENECYASAKQNSGVDPQAPAPAAPSAQDQQAAQKEAAQQAGKDVPKGGAVKGSAKGAAGGAAVGAIAGDAGTGAAIGATAGAMAGRRAQKKGQKEAQKQASQQTAQSQQQAQSEATAQHQAQLDTFKRAFSACMDAHGYSVQ